MGAMRSAYCILPEKGRNHLGGLDVDGTIMLKYILLRV
jgi:hypothetical protein